MGYSTCIEKSPSQKKSNTCLVSNPTKYHHYYHNQVWVCVCVYVCGCGWLSARLSHDAIGTAAAAEKPWVKEKKKRQIPSTDPNPAACYLVMLYNSPNANL